MIVSHRHRFIFFAVPRTGSHAVRAALQPEFPFGALGLAVKLPAPPQALPGIAEMPLALDRAVGMYRRPAVDSDMHRPSDSSRHRAALERAMSTTPAQYPPVPYGRGNFRSVRLDRCLYVDKTRFIRTLEQERFVFFIRPRRFGKTLWLTMLNAYYDRAQAKDFDAVFAGIDIGREPTGNRSRYVVLYLDFSAFKQALPTLEESFDEHCTLHVSHALWRNRDLFDEDAARAILAPPSINGKLQALFLYASDHDIPLYVLIDEYDNFANTILAHRGAEAYHSFTHGEGFFRNFFGTLKAGTAESGAIERLFVTGVSPITMDDVTSGFNIGANVSLLPEFNEMLGFTEAEVRDLLETYRRAGAFDQDPDTALDLMREWYDGYRFAEDAERDVYNTDMVLYYLMHSVPNKRGPRDLIDSNIRIDYGKLRHLLLVNRQIGARPMGTPEYVPTGEAELNGNFDLLRQVVAEERVDVHIRDSFPLKRLTERESFLSLLHYFGLLSIRAMVEGRPRLGIPNQTVKRLLFGHLREAFEDIGAFTADLYTLEQRIHEMAYRGAWRPVFDHLADAVARQTGVRDYIAGEKVLQGFLAAFLGTTGHFVFHSERELGGGYADICLAPNLASYVDMRHGYVVELKYVKRGERRERAIEEAAEEAVTQLRRYLSDETLGREYPTVRFTGLALVFHGWELVRGEAVPAPPAVPARPAKRTTAPNPACGSAGRFS